MNTFWRFPSILVTDKAQVLTMKDPGVSVSICRFKKNDILKLNKSRHIWLNGRSRNSSPKKVLNFPDEGAFYVFMLATSHPKTFIFVSVLRFTTTILHLVRLPTFNSRPAHRCLSYRLGPRACLLTQICSKNKHKCLRFSFHSEPMN